MDEKALAHYKGKFARLRTARGAKHFPAETQHRAPHKPMLLLSIFDLIAQGQVTANLFELSPDLRETFYGYWALTPLKHRKGDIALPYNHLVSDGFWHLIPRDDNRRPTRILKSPSVSLLDKRFVGARFDADLYTLLTHESARDELRAVLYDTFFMPALQAALRLQSQINIEGSAYGATLLQRPDKKRLREIQAVYAPEVRDAGFRKAIVQAYNHRCAFCGIRMVTPEFHTVIEAAHIMPWSVSQNDDPTNGIALCRLCHWAFDEGLFSVSARHQVMASATIMQPPNIPSILSAQVGRDMLMPSPETHHPDPDALAWHREHVFVN